MFETATKKKSKLRLALYGPAGSGKTFSALSIAQGLSNKTQNIAVIDTEHGSAAKYADTFSFDVCELKSTTIDDYIKAIEHANNHYDVLIIDSLSHAWQSLLDKVEKIAKAKYRGNSWSAWSEGTPKQRSLIDAILKSPCHIIVTMRSKTEWVSQTNERGRTTPTRIGLAPEQGKGIEYEFDFLASLTPEHQLHIEKSRASSLQGCIIDKPNQALGEQLNAWLNDGSAPSFLYPKKKKHLIQLLYQTGYQAKRNIDELTNEEADSFIKMLIDKAKRQEEEYDKEEAA